MRQLCKLCWWKIFAKIHRQSLQIALIFKILFQKPTRLSVFGKKFDPADLVTRDVSSLLLSCLCSIYFGLYKVNMAGNTRFYNTRQNKTVWARKIVQYICQLKRVLEKRKQNWQIFGYKKKRFLAKYFHFKTCHVILRSLSCSVQYLVPETCRLREIEWQNFSGTRKIENSTEFLYEMLHNFLAGKASKTTLFNFLPKVLPGETLCKLVQIFPPKVLVYIRKVFLDTI